MSIEWLDVVREQLARHEGRKNKAYQCPAGYWTIGIGHNIEALGLEIGDELIDELFDRDVQRALGDAKTFFKGFDKLNYNRQAVLVNMAFQLGLTTLTKFKNFRAALSMGDYSIAAKEMLDSKWAKKDTPDRAQELAEIMRIGA